VSAAEIVADHLNVLGSARPRHVAEGVLRLLAYVVLHNPGRARQRLSFPPKATS